MVAAEDREGMTRAGDHLDRKALGLTEGLSIKNKGGEYWGKILYAGIHVCVVAHTTTVLHTHLNECAHTYA